MWPFRTYKDEINAEDAEKWREHKKKEDAKKLRQTAALMCNVNIKGEEGPIPLRLAAKAKEHKEYSWSSDRIYTIIETAESNVKEKYQQTCRNAATLGVTIGDTFYPSHMILNITQVSLTVTDPEE